MPGEVDGGLSLAGGPMAEVEEVQHDILDARAGSDLLLTIDIEVLPINILHAIPYEYIHPCFS